MYVFANIGNNGLSFYFSFQITSEFLSLTNWRTYGRESGNCRPCLLLYNIAGNLERDGVVTDLTTDTPVHCAKMLILWAVQDYEINGQIQLIFPKITLKMNLERKANNKSWS